MTVDVWQVTVRKLKNRVIKPQIELKMSKVNDVATLYKQLKAEWGATKPNLSKCGQLLSDLKVNFLRFLGYVYRSDFLFQV